MFQNRAHNVLFVVSLTMIFHARCCADPPGPPPREVCYVMFDLNEEPLKEYYGIDAPDLEKKTAGFIADSLAKSFPHWTFQPTQSSNDFPRLKVWLEKLTSWRIRSNIEHNIQGSERQSWDGVLFSPEEVNQMGGFPPLADMPVEIAKRFDQTILSQYKAQIELALRDVPLVRAVMPVKALLLSKTDRVLGVLPLMWDRYSDLAGANFKIVCKWPQHGAIQIFSHGIRECVRCVTSASPYYAVEAEYDKWETDKIGAHLADLGELVISAIYLREHEWEGVFDCDQIHPAVAR